jgi:hypothetical protein
MANSLVGDIIEIEFTDDYDATDPTWNVVGKTTDTVEFSPGVETADSRIHSQFSRVVNAVSELWEISFSAHVVTGTAQLESLELIDTNNYELKGYADSRESDATNPAVKITAYANEADQSSGTVKWDLGTHDYLIVDGGAGLNVEDYSTRDITIYSRVRPIRLEAGGTFPSP